MYAASGCGLTAQSRWYRCARLSDQQRPLASVSGPLLALAGVNIIWGCAFPLTKPALLDIPPFSFALLRFALSLAVLLPLCGRRALPLLRSPDRWRIVVAGVFGFTLAQTGQ